jgi:thiol:disulfide interchange protein DsbC
MRKITLLIVLAAFLVLSGHGDAYAFSKGDQDCSKCHTITKEQAKSIMDNLFPNVKIIHAQPSPITGLWEIGIDVNGIKAIVYLDYAKNHIISPQATGGNVVDLKTKTNLTQESLQNISKVDVSQIPLKDALFMGDEKAKYKVIVFDDPD